MRCFIVIDLDSLSDWCDVNVVYLNVNTCYKIIFARRNLPFNYPYKINDLVLQETNHIKDLGVTLNSKLSYNSHIHETPSKSLKCSVSFKDRTLIFLSPV